MTDPSLDILDVSDTAIWMAAYRAEESSRADALFRDPIAERLAGKLRAAVLSAKVAVPGSRSGWPPVVRTKLIDDLLARSFAAGCDRVINLAAGWDTRPYRLELPADLLWFEADLPRIVTAKNTALAADEPGCRLLRQPVNLTDPDACEAFVTAAVAGARQPLVITEGLLQYLEPAQVQTLSDILYIAGIDWWITDLWTPVMLRLVNRTMGRHLGDAQWAFAPSDGAGFFHGWTAADEESIFRAAARWRRSPRWLRPARALPAGVLRSGVVRLHRPE
ncbi:class I SAM-dependent methyltransferase [Nocardia sp. 2]|uniref:S-adenosyl-L-methionine-dependent methyltransferase n=1 Tax=Nocardia acididurans TaxID=2802282 RepID=A0ABS1MB71_9NOCA|nr:SAM-dependent methyltransferase [Nocardia acididurans]MBL1076433.1 class I SAM-dependent methyltransferase [Nocardia acididurans]